MAVDGTSNKITHDYPHSAEITNNIEQSDGIVLVVDGVTNLESVTFHRACSTWRRQRAEGERTFVTVSSVSVTVALEQLIAAKIVEFNLASWTLEQYKLACANQAFYDSIKEKLRCPGFEECEDQQELLLSKYDHAGGCARWMFEFNHAEWLRDFTVHLKKVNDYKLVFGECSGDENSIAVNHLRGATVLTTNGIEEKKYFFISKYVARELAKKCDDKRKFLIDSYKHAADTKNPAFCGWIFEFDVDYQLQQAFDNQTIFRVGIRLTQEEKDGNVAEERLVSCYVNFKSESDLIVPILQLAAGQVLWAKPVLWCQKAYDFICVWKTEGDKLHMLAVNASHAKTHSVLLNVVNKLASTLGENGCVIEAIRFNFLVPSGVQFEVGQLEGRLCEWKNLKGAQWPNMPNSATYLTGSFIVVANIDQTSR